ncbi:MAG: PspC domain-containing protein [Bacteroidales bacterium]|jgi:phage shock protein C|nr:PspC domain-containing protein [Bacteroidales bacterium]
MEPKKLRRSYKDSVIGGVAGGLGEYFATDPLIFRILFVVLLFTGGGGFLIYILMWIFIPKDEPKYDEGLEEPPKEEPITPETKKSKTNNGSIIGGAILIMIGLFFLMDNFLPWIHFADLWPVALVIAGLAIVKMNYSKNKKENENDDAEQSTES